MRMGCGEGTRRGRRGGGGVLVLASLLVGLRDGNGEAGPRAGFIGSGEATGGFQVLTVVFVSGSPPL